MTKVEYLLGAVCGDDDLSHLTLKERARMRRLRDWLAAPTWNPSQSMAVLCGYDPEVGRNTCAADISFLPGADDFYGVPANTCEPDDLRALDAGLEEQHGYISGLRLTTMPPMETITKTVAAGVPIPWLEAARADSHCRKYLPHETLDITAGVPHVPLTASEVASRGGKSKRDKDPQRAKWLPLVEEHIVEGWTATEILAKLEEEDDAPPRSTLFRWCKDIRERTGNK